MNGRLEKMFTVVATAWGVLRIIAMRPKVIVLGTDMIGSHAYEPRMAAVYQWLDDTRTPYAHLVHVVPHGRVVRHWFQRRRPVVYLEALERMKSKGLSWILRKSGARYVWAIDDYRTWPRVVAAARKAGIPSALFQHGRFTRHQGYLALPEISAMPETYIVWNEYWRGRLLAINPAFRRNPGVVQVGGKPSTDAPLQENARVAPGAKLQVMVVHEPAAEGEEIRTLVDRLAAVPDIKRIYKIRGDQSAEVQLAHHGLGERMSAGHWTVTASLVPCDLVLGSYSTLLYEVIAAHIPVGVLKIASLQADDLVDDGLATLLDVRATGFAEQLRAAAQIPDQELNRRAAVLAVTVDIRDTLKALLHSYYVRD